MDSHLKTKFSTEKIYYPAKTVDFDNIGSVNELYVFEFVDHGKIVSRYSTRGTNLVRNPCQMNDQEGLKTYEEFGERFLNNFFGESSLADNSTPRKELSRYFLQFNLDNEFESSEPIQTEYERRHGIKATYLDFDNFYFKRQPPMDEILLPNHSIVLPFNDFEWAAFNKGIHEAYDKIDELVLKELKEIEASLSEQ
ncbi:hypothetical protein CMI38_02575 [Candidatus Pacearchaeota archaeon]|nr:hypothetical protein [Candidatus Pacearchaeota archaeon]|tara:strand:- start:660 stop:1247 length:588 start_codon:yes stop_codon:yes gene_type:complete